MVHFCSDLVFGCSYEFTIFFFILVHRVYVELILLNFVNKFTTTFCQNKPKKTSSRSRTQNAEAAELYCSRGLRWKLKYKVQLLWRESARWTRPARVMCVCTCVCGCIQTLAASQRFFSQFSCNYFSVFRLLKNV